MSNSTNENLAPMNQCIINTSALVKMSVTDLKVLAEIMLRRYTESVEAYLKSVLDLSTNAVDLDRRLADLYACRADALNVICAVQAFSGKQLDMDYSHVVRLNKIYTTIQEVQPPTTNTDTDTKDGTDTPIIAELNNP